MKLIRRLMAISLALACALGGLTWLYLGITLVLKMFSNPEAGTFVLAFLFIGMGAVVTLIGGYALFKPTESSLKNLCILSGFAMVGIMHSVLKPAADLVHDAGDMRTHGVLMILPFILGVAAYHYLKALFADLVEPVEHVK